LVGLLFSGTFYFIPITLKGNVRIAPMNLITTSSVNPTILKGKRISQTSGNNTTIIMAIGQQSTSRIHQRINPIKILMSLSEQNVRHFKKPIINLKFKDLNTITDHT
jgi:hypothetical protein